MSALIDAWQQALAAEQQASFGYALLGPQLDEAQHYLAWRDSVAHETLRDDTAEAIAASGTTPVEPPADYPALYPVSGARAALGLAVRLENDCCSAWRYFYAVAASGPARDATALHTDATALRSDAQRALSSGAARATRWRMAAGTAPATVAFPGI